MREGDGRRGRMIDREKGLGMEREEESKEKECVSMDDTPSSERREGIFPNLSTHVHPASSTWGSNAFI